MPTWPNVHLSNRESMLTFSERLIFVSQRAHYRGQEIFNFGGPPLDHHNYIIKLSVLCSAVVKKISKEIVHVQQCVTCMTYMVMS